MALGVQGDGHFLPFAVAGEKLMVAMALSRIAYSADEKLNAGVTMESMAANPGPMNDNGVKDIAAHFVDMSLTRDGAPLPIALYLTARQFNLLADAVMARVDLGLSAGAASGVSSTAAQPWSADILELARSRHDPKAAK